MGDRAGRVSDKKGLLLSDRGSAQMSPQRHRVVAVAGRIPALLQAAIASGSDTLTG